ncbi:hypothetical protein [Kineococcus sp. SYSU DK003]|uniref:hypothetical protein n=1 Tax=Kineococcus sp. SYSU DK003 TaxID=3383124 RepID=UPI003D7EAFE8
MTQTPSPPSASANVTDLSNAGSDSEDPATRAARARHTNAQRATYAAEALQVHSRVSRSHTDDMQQALVELLTDLHHLCNACDLELTTLLQAAAIIHANETQLNWDAS